MYENRIQRWAAVLAGFNYRIEYIKGKDNVVADYFSRKPSKTETQPEENVSYLNFTSKSDDWPLNNAEIKKYTDEDENLQKIIKYTSEERWPADIDEKMKPYYNNRNELSVESGILMRGLRIVIPRLLRTKMLNMLHEGHNGIVKMKNTARSLMYWENIDKDIEETAKRCVQCASTKQAPPKRTLTPWPIECIPFHRIHVDLCGPIKGTMFLIIIDAYTKWMEAAPMTKTTTKEIIEKLRAMFARFGIPTIMVSDNGTAFVSEEMEYFLKLNVVRHITSPPGHQQSNGAAEAAVKIFKTKLQAMIRDEENRNTSIATLTARVLQNYRTTIQESTRRTPSYMLFKREIRTRLNSIQIEQVKSDNEVQQNLMRAQERQIKNYRRRERKIAIGDHVMVKDYRNPNKTEWSKAVIETKIGRSTFICRMDSGRRWKRHYNQIRVCQWEAEEKENKGNADNNDDNHQKNVRDRPLQKTSTTIPSTISNDLEIAVPIHRSNKGAKDCTVVDKQWAF